MEVPLQKGSHIAQTILARFLNKNQENDHQNMEKVPKTNQARVYSVEETGHFL